MRSFFISIFFLVFITACGYTPAPPVAPNPPPTNSNQPVIYQQPKAPPVSVVYTNDNTDRDRSRSNRCGGDDDCEDICKKIFGNRSDKDDCEDLSVSEVEDMEEFFEVLEDPDEDDLEDLDLSILENIIDISFDPVKDEVSRYSSSDSKEFLLWLLSDESAADVITDEDDNHELLEELLENLKSDIVEALGTNIDGSDNFMDLAVEDENEKLLEWVHDFLEEGSSSSSSKDCEGDARCTFDKYCRIADNLDSDTREDILDFNYFEDFMEDVYSDANDQEKDVDDLDDYGDDCRISKYRTTSTGKSNNNNNNNNNDNSYNPASGTCNFLTHFGKQASNELVWKGDVVYFHKAATLNTDGDFCLWVAASVGSRMDKCHADPTTETIATPVSDGGIRNLKSFKLKNGKYKFTFKSNEKTQKIVGFIVYDGSNATPYPVSPIPAGNGSRLNLSFSKVDSLDNDKLGVAVVYEKDNGKCGTL